MLVPRPLAGRYALTKRIQGTQRTVIWLARDQGTGAPVVASVVPGPRAIALKPALGLNHVHAASILQVIDEPDPAEVPSTEPLDAEARVVVAEYVAGRSLQQRLDAGPVAVETAVEWMASIADALIQLHSHGAVHGAVSPRALIVVRSEPAIVPILTHLVVPPSGAFCSPERVTGGGPSELDDAWALSATLYSALSRRAPFEGASRKELAKAIVASSPRRIAVDSALWDVVSRGLSSDPKRRLSTVVGLRDALRDWMDQAGVKSLGDFAPVAALVGPSEPPPNVGDLSLVAALERPESAEATAPFRVDAAQDGDHPAGADVDDISEEVGEIIPSVIPPPPTFAQAPLATTPVNGRASTDDGSAPSVSSSAKPAVRSSERSPATIALAIALAAGASAGIGVVVGKMRSAEKHELARPSDVAVDTAPKAARAAPGATPPLAASAPVSAAFGSAAPVASAPAGAPADVTACARAVLPPGTLGSSPDVKLDYLCTQGDLWGIARKLDLTIAKRGQGPGMVLWAHLGRFDLAAISVLIGQCCPASTAFTAATPKGVCETLPTAVRDVSRDPSPKNIDAYADGVDCFISHGVRYPAEWWDRVGPKDARGYFDEYLKGLRKP